MMMTKITMTIVFSCLLVVCLYCSVASAAPQVPQYAPTWSRRHTPASNVAYERYVRRRPPTYFDDQEIFEVREFYYKPRPKLPATTTPSTHYIDDNLMDLIILCDFQPAPRECENLPQRRRQTTKMPTILLPTPTRTTTSTTTTTTTTRRPTRPSYQSIPTLPPILTTTPPTPPTTTTTTRTTTSTTTTTTDLPPIPKLEFSEEEIEEQAEFPLPGDQVKNEDQEEEDRPAINFLPESEAADHNEDTEEEENKDYNENENENEEAATATATEGDVTERTTIANNEENNNDKEEEEEEEENYEIDNSIDYDTQDNDGMGQLDHSLSNRK